MADNVPRLPDVDRAHLSEAKAWDWHEVAKATVVTEVNVPQAEPARKSLAQQVSRC